MNNQSEKKYTFFVQGMHCKACVMMTESELQDISYIKSAKTSLKNNTVEVVGDFGDKSTGEISEDLTKVLIKHGYTVSVEPQEISKNFSEFNVALPIAFGFMFLFYLLQKIGIINLVNTNGVSYGTAFVVGIVASLSTCMAIVGGIVLSMSATFAKGGDKIKPQLMFHVGRIVSFFVLGGVIGSLGSMFVIGSVGTFVLSLVVGLVMLLMGINLLDVFHKTKKFLPGMPKSLSKRAFGVSKLNHTLTPLLVGVATFFLPCGFTQSMQIFTLATGSFLKGGLTMLSFALGTLPVLALISFSSFGIQKSSKPGIFFKSAGLIVIMFAVFNIINSLVVVGIINPVFNF